MLEWETDGILIIILLILSFKELLIRKILLLQQSSRILAVMAELPEMVR